MLPRGLQGSAQFADEEDWSAHFVSSGLGTRASLSEDAPCIEIPPESGAAASTSGRMTSDQSQSVWAPWRLNDIEIRPAGTGSHGQSLSLRDGLCAKDQTLSFDAHLGSRAASNAQHSDSRSLPCSPDSSSTTTDCSTNIANNRSASWGTEAASAGLSSPETQTEASNYWGSSKANYGLLLDIAPLSEESPFGVPSASCEFQPDLEAYTPWSRENGGKAGPTSESRTNRVTSPSSESNRGSASESSESDSLTSVHSKPHRSACNKGVLGCRLRSQASSSNILGHVCVQFEEDDMDKGFISIHQRRQRPSAQELPLRKIQQRSAGRGAYHASVPSSRAHRRIQEQLSRKGQRDGSYKEACHMKLEMEEGLRKQRLAQPMRQRLLRQYTEHLRKLDAVKAQASRCEEEADKLRPLLTKVALAASKLRALQSSGSWKEYVGAPVTDVDADLTSFMANFGEDFGSTTAEGDLSSSTGSGLCSHFWKRRTVSGIFLALMVLYLVVIGGVFVWLQQAGSNYYAPTSST